MKNNKLKIVYVLLCGIFFAQTLRAQSDSIPLFTKFKLETRFDFDYSYNRYPYLLSDPTHDYGFVGRYFNLIMGGNINQHFSYFFRQRIIPKPGMPNLFDNTDFLYLTWKINRNFAITTGKQCLHIGSFEYDAAPIDVYFNTEFWNQVACFQLGVAASYTDDSEKNMLVLQMTNSPYLYDGSLAERIFGRGLFAYSLAWYGNFNHFKTIYSINMIERERGKFINYIALGNKFEFKHVSFYIDYLNRAASFNKFFSDFTVVGRLDVKLGQNFVLFAKGGYDQNCAERFGAFEVMDLMVAPGASFSFAGLGAEFRPTKFQGVRIHAFVLYKNMGVFIPNSFYQNVSSYYSQTELWSANMGVTWDLNFLKFIRNNRIGK